ncbi:YcdB/YcdC domain-containing protein [Brevibacillus borstelensis]|uniref:YcdB/YcdC domain-containing protein n=1 Tax=Brevibacillus borstelensis TaxID=45462 RepID=UPI0030C35D3D
MGPYNKVVFVLAIAGALASAPVSSVKLGAKEGIARETKQEKAQGNIQDDIPENTRKTNEQAVQTTGNKSTVAAELMKKIESSLAKTKKLLPSLEDYPYMTVTVDEKRADSAFVRLTKQKDQENVDSYVALRFDTKTGELISFQLGTEGKRDNLAKGEDAKARATAFLKEWYGTDLRGYKLNPKITGGGEVVFSKEVNGLFYPNLSVRIVVDGDGQIINGGPATLPNFKYEIPSFEDTLFPDPEEALPREQLEKNVASHMSLAYWADYGLLVYRPAFSGYLDARTGKVLDVPQIEYEHRER